MNDRKQKVKEFIDIFQTLQRVKGFRPPLIPHITPAQWGVLMVLDTQGKSNVKDIASTLKISSSAATQLIDGLVAHGYVVRQEDTNDRRRIILFISKKSEKEISRIKKQIIEKFLTSFSVLSDAELDQLILLNKKIVDGIIKRSESHISINNK